MKKKQPIVKEKETGVGIGLETIIHTKTGLFLVRDVLPPILKKNATCKPFVPLRSEEQMKLKYLGKQPGYKITTISGRSFVVQNQCPFVSVGKKSKLSVSFASQLRVGSEFFLHLGGTIENSKLKYPFNIKTDEEIEAFISFIGAYLKSGSIVEDWLVFPKEVPISIVENLNKIGAWGKIKPRELKKDQFWSFNCPELLSWVKEYCKEEQFKVIPSLILNSTNVEILRSLLLALIFKHYALGWNVTHPSLTLVYQILEILTRLDIYARVELEPRYCYSGLPTLTISMPYVDTFTAFVKGEDYVRKTDRSTWVMHSPMSVYRKIAAEDKNVDIESVLTKGEIGLCKSLIEQKLVRQVVAKVERVNTEFVELVIDGNGK
jgi:hypothetical protein